MPATTIDEVILHLEQIIQTSITEESAHGYFAALYQKVTITVKEKLGKNYFDDDARMERLDVIFANRYLAAYTSHKQGAEITKSWEAAFHAAETNDLIVLQHLLLGMNVSLRQTPYPSTRFPLLSVSRTAAAVARVQIFCNLGSD